VSGIGAKKSKLCLRKFAVDQELRTASEDSCKQQIRFDYKYDARGNWTERVVWIRYGSNPEFQRSNIERREISYYES